VRCERRLRDVTLAVRLKLLGGLVLEGPEGRPIHLSTRKAFLVLAALALVGDKGLRREALAELLWPDRSEPQARSSLRQALTAIRAALGGDEAGLRLTADAETVRLAGPVEHVDARAFDRLADSVVLGEQVQACGLFGGDLLEGVALDQPADRWFGGYAAAFQRRALALCEGLSRRAADDDTAARACEALAHRLLDRDPAAEEAHRALMRIGLARGQRNAARRQLEQCRDALRRELDAAPEPATLALLDESAVPAPPRTLVAATPASAAESPASADRTASARRGASLVVMPFDDLSAVGDSFFADGIVEEITSALSRIRELFVIARQSAFTYKGRFVDVREVGRELGVRYVVEGTVRRGGDRVRISVHLVDAETRSQLWSGRYDGETGDIFALQDMIASQVAGALHPSLRAFEIENARRKAPDSLEAYDLVLRAYPHFWAHAKDDNRIAIALLDQALQRDPRYGVALAFKAWCHAQEASYVWADDPGGERALALRLADRAAAEVDDHASALIAIGAAHGLTTTNQDRAAAYIERALAIDPNNAWGWTRLGWATALRRRPDEALAHFERSLALSPFDPLAFNVHFGMAMAWHIKGDYRRATALVEKGLRARPSAVWAYRMLAAFHANAGNDAQAQEAMRTFLSHFPHASISLLRAAMPPSIIENNMDYFAGLVRAGLPKK
jgi:TolB-like protein/Flp pilus assembly protein TadD